MTQADDLACQVFTSVWRTYRYLRQGADVRCDLFNITIQQAIALEVLRLAGPEGLPTLKLANRLMSRAPDITRLLDPLVDRGLIARERRSDNRRIVSVRITADGLTMLQSLDGELRQSLARLMGHMPLERLHQLQECLASVCPTPEHEEQKHADRFSGSD